MRGDFQDEFARVGSTLTTMAKAVREAMRQASAALLAADQNLAAQVTVRDAEIDVLNRVVDDRVQDLIARRQPIGGDLRMLLTALQVSADLERMGDLAVHVARVTLRRSPAPAVVPELGGLFAAMAAAADDLSTKLVTALADHDVEVAAGLDRDDDTMDQLHTELFSVMLSTDWPMGVEAAVDGALLGRYYERYADHVVNIGHHVMFLANGGVRSPHAESGA
jgi:phosphate transport system protein